MPRREQKSAEPRCDKCGIHASKTPRGKAMKAAAEARAAQQEVQMQQAMRQAAMQRQRAMQAMRPGPGMGQGMAAPGVARPPMGGPGMAPQMAGAAAPRPQVDPRVLAMLAARLRGGGR